MILASVVGVSQFSKNDVKDAPSDRYELYPACTTLLRSQVNVEMHASLVYMSMAAHFDQSGIARKGFSKLFRENSKSEREHAQMFIDYLNLRGSKFTDFNIDMPEKTSWNSAVEALNDAIVLEKEVYNHLHHIHDVADVHCKDSHLMDFLENEFFKEQVESIDSFIRHSSILGSMADDKGLAEYLYDKQLKEELHH
ncbi:ferritin heavy chain, oocyte isoform [Trichonephila inaurata madagascariensis]|uniref:Ferritin n=1 Tax=Trichonephila inaurata madagascariensis TaxID=2747483 RepID=A0A8X6YND0_9ARAC|nr:ferritin heavy chain, oocyte isoform [Trichonephila inaurata madagascariensis]